MRINIKIAILFCSMILAMPQAFCQQKKEATPKVILKTNVLNALIIPSLHAECKLGQRTSIQANFHRARFVFFNENSSLALSAEARYYFSKVKASTLTGIYGAIGAGLFHDYLETRAIDSFGNTQIGLTSLALPTTRLGMQFAGKSARLYGDFGIGINYHAAPLQKDNLFNAEPQMRLMVAIGYRIW
jgi:hypothetical protein